MGYIREEFNDRASAGRGSLLHDIKLSNFAGPNAGA
jgi:hypothetical protein